MKQAFFILSVFDAAMLISALQIQSDHGGQTAHGIDVTLKCGITSFTSTCDISSLTYACDETSACDVTCLTTTSDVTFFDNYTCDVTLN